MAGTDVARIVAESRAAQGLPPKVTDPATLGRVVAILAANRPDRRKAGAKVDVNPDRAAA